MKYWLYIILLILITSNSVSQTLLAPAIKVGEKKWGYINERGQYVISPRYSFCNKFSKCGLAGVYDNFSDKGLFINRYGDTIIEENDEYSFCKLKASVGIAGFVDSALIVKKNEFYGAINTFGKIIIPLEYNSLSNFNRGIAVGIKDEIYYILNKKNIAIKIKLKNLKKVDPFHNGFASFETNDNRFGFINFRGEIVVEPRFLSVGIFEEGLAWAELSSHKYGYINYHGEWVIEPNLWKACDFNKGSYYVPVIIQNGEYYCFVSKKGQELILPEDIRIRPTYGFRDGLAVVSKDLNDGCINMFGQWKIMPIFKNIYKFYNGHAVAQKDRFIGIIDKNGNWTAPPEFTRIGKLVRLNHNTE